MDGTNFEALINAIEGARPEDAARILREYASEFETPEGGFSECMRTLLREKGLRQQDLFLKADISEGYGYKLISGEKHTRRRDTLLRLFFAAGFSAEEVERLLRLSSMPTLYPRFARDAVLMIALSSGMRDPAAVDELLSSVGLEPLYPSH